MSIHEMHRDRIIPCLARAIAVFPASCRLLTVGQPGPKVGVQRSIGRIFFLVCMRVVRLRVVQGKEHGVGLRCLFTSPPLPGLSIVGCFLSMYYRTFAWRLSGRLCCRVADAVAVHSQADVLRLSLMQPLYSCFQGASKREFRKRPEITVGLSVLDVRYFPTLCYYLAS